MNQNQNTPLPQPRIITSALELTFAGAIWGFGFVATRWALETVGPMQLSALRFFIAGLAGLCLWALIDGVQFLVTRKTKRHQTSISALNAIRSFSKQVGTVLKLAWIPGLCISATLVLQTWGLTFTTVTKSGFITCVYVLIVPFLTPFFGGAAPGRRMWIAAIVAFFGVALMGGVLQSDPASLIQSPRDQLNIGDLLTLACAFAGAVHILALDRLMKTAAGQNISSFALNVGQSLVAWIPASLAAWLINEDFGQTPRLISEMTNLESLSNLGFLSVTFGSTLIAFALQVRAQKVLSATLAAILFLLEGPFAALFGVVLLNEPFLAHHFIGAGLIVTAVLLAILKSKSPIQTE